MNGDDQSAVSPLIVQQVRSPWIKCRLGTHERKRPRLSPKRLRWPELSDQPLGPCDSAVGLPILVPSDVWARSTAWGMGLAYETSHTPVVKPGRFFASS